MDLLAKLIPDENRKQNADQWPAFYVSLNNELFSYYVYDHFREYFAVNWKLTSCSPVVRRTPFGRRTSLLATSTPAAVTASAMSRVPMEPNSLPSSPALDAMVTVSSALIFSARALAAARTSASLASSSARRASKNSMFFLVAGTALPCSTRGSYEHSPL